MKYYHATPRRLRVGDRLTPCLQKTGMEQGVYLNSRPEPHFTIAAQAVADNWHVYEVTPIGATKVGSFEDIVAPMGAEIVRRVGNARGIHVGNVPSKPYTAHRFNGRNWTRIIKP